jgi:3-dehydroquinate synthase
MTKIKTTHYPIYISNNITKDIKQFLKKCDYSKLFILVDENSLKHCYPQLVTEIPAFEDAEIIEIESGEENKNIEICTQLWTALTELQADKQALLINLGGGVIGDMGGFIAAAYKRGIRFINIPTTLLSQVDASVGGKVGVDLNHLKNCVGFYANPQAVFIDTTFLQTLDTQHLLSGFAEIVKHALIADRNYWQLLQQTDINNSTHFDALVETSVLIKNSIVEADPFEKNIRKSLNFGHTIGHALETYFLEQQDSAKALLHGEAIAIGMICEAYISNKVMQLSDAELKEITTFIKSLYKPIKLNKQDFDNFINLMRNDKKNENGQINFSLLAAIGKCEINQTASADLIKEALNYYLK